MCQINAVITFRETDKRPAPNRKTNANLHSQALLLLPKWQKNVILC